MRFLISSPLFMVLLILGCSTQNQQIKEENYLKGNVQDPTEMTTTITPEIRDNINIFVKGGFDSPERIFEIFSEEIYAPNKLDTRELRKVIEDLFNEKKKDMQSWEKVTDNDRLTLAFEELNRHKIIALENAGYTQSDGYDDVLDILENNPNNDYLGYCYYQGQDMERGVSNLGIYLSFGPIDYTKEEDLGPVVGQQIINILNKYDLKTEWDGTFNSRIQIVDFKWQRR